MAEMFDSHFFLLAKGGWMDFIWVVVILGFYLINIISKMSSKQNDGDAGETETSKAIELAKKYVRQRQAQQEKLQTSRRSVRNNEFTSDWDREQELKRQQLARHRDLEERKVQHSEPIKIAPVAKPPQPPRMVPPQIPKYREVPDFIQPKQRPAIRKRVAKKQPEQIRQTYRTTPQHRTAKPKETPVMKIKTSRPLEILLKHPNQLRSAIILKEILDKPIAMREIF